MKLMTETKFILSNYKNKTFAINIKKKTKLWHSEPFELITKTFVFLSVAQ